jgi:hypothetical protein
VSPVVADALVPGDELYDRVMSAYLPHCRYVRSFRLEDGDELAATAEYHIGESCYIADTGHLNAAEVNICYNQLLYLLLATAVRFDLHPVFESWTLEDYYARQLADVLIARYRCDFARGIGASEFTGRIVLDRITDRPVGSGGQRIVMVDSRFEFGDGSGFCRGEVRVAIPLRDR